MMSLIKLTVYSIVNSIPDNIMKVEIQIISDKGRIIHTRVIDFVIHILDVEE